MVVPDGLYRPRVRLDLQEQEIELQNEIRVDTTPARVTVTSVAPRIISPDGDGRAERVRVGYAADEPVQAVLRVGGIRRVLEQGVPPPGQLEWFGRVDERPVRARTYPLTAGRGTDLAGNRSRPVGGGVVRVRYVELVPALYRTLPGRAPPGRRLDRRPACLVAPRRPDGDGYAPVLGCARRRSPVTTACS